MEIYRSVRLADCEQRAFVLDALGIHSEIATEHGVFVLRVPEEARTVALSHLATYEAESRTAEPPPAPDKAHPNAWMGSAGYAAVMIVAAYCAGQSLLGADWYAAGALRGTLLQTGEWWRTVTALTLHADLAHLVANLCFGIFFGYFAGQLLGPGIAWLSILVAAILGNALDSALMPSGRSSLGASTAVFATLGLVAAHAWRRGSNRRMRWAHRWAPLIAGVALLAFTGTGGENTDVLAHAAGFFSGTLFGAVHAHWPMRRFTGARAQLASGMLALATIAGAWSSALLR